MALGQAAGAAAALAIDLGTSVQTVPMESLQGRLIDEKATLIYFEDVTPDDPDFGLVQRLGLKGVLTGWKARLDERCRTPTARRAAFGSEALINRRRASSPRRRTNKGRADRAALPFMIG